VNLAASSGLDATPVSFRPSQSPLVSSPGPLVAVGALAPSFRHPSRPAFGSSRCFLTFRFHLTAPEPVTRPTTLLSLAGAGVVRPRALVCTPPLSRFGRVSAPWFQAQAPGHFYISSRCAGLGARDFPQIPLLPIGHFHLTVPSPFPGLRHCFRSLCAGVVRPRALVCTPPLSRIGPSQSPLVISPGPSASLLSADDFPRERLSNPVVRLSPHGSQDPRGPCNASRPALPAACSGLHATPAFLSSAELPDTHPTVRLPNILRRSRVFRHWMVSLCSHEHPRRVGPVTDSHS